MHWIDVAIILSIGNMVAWMVAIYVKDAIYGLFGHVIISTLGAFIASYVSLGILPKYGTSVMVPSAFVGAVILLYLVRFRKWSWQKE